MSHTIPQKQKPTQKKQPHKNQPKHNPPLQKVRPNRKKDKFPYFTIRPAQKGGRTLKLEYRDPFW